MSDSTHQIISVEQWQNRLPHGLIFQTGPFHIRLSIREKSLLGPVSLLFENYPVLPDHSVIDHDISASPSKSLRHQLIPRVSIFVDGQRNGSPVARSIALPMLMWAINGTTFQHPHQYLILHAGVVARDGKAVILPGTSGSGKSTLTAALVSRGYQLLSDEIALIQPHNIGIQPAPLPVSLKNQSIEIIKHFSPQLTFGPTSHHTAKGSVAHVQIQPQDIASSLTPVMPGLIITPGYASNASTQLTPVDQARLHLQIGIDSFNYSILGQVGFETLSSVINASKCFALTYSDLEQAIKTIDEALQMITHDSNAISNKHNENQVIPRQTELPEKNHLKISQPASAPQSHDAQSILLNAVHTPKSMIELQPTQWNILLRAARQSKLLARLRHRAILHDVFDELPIKAQEQMNNAQTYADSHRAVMHWEANRLHYYLQDVLEEHNAPLVLLKGAAYAIADLPVGQNRLMSDVDIMVPYRVLDHVEQRLAASGWDPTKLHPYDQRYYRRWMHELPPMRHHRRQVEIDIHHALLPLTGRLNPDSDKLLDNIVQIPDTPYYMLHPIDLFLHSACHFFMDGEFTSGIRDLTDMDLMLRDFSTKDPLFFEKIPQRAAEMDLARPAWYALYFCKQLLKTPIPDTTFTAMKDHQPARIIASMMDFAFNHALRPDNDRAQNPFKLSIARKILYMRAHWLRMPPFMLIRHLAAKSWRSMHPVKSSE